MTGARVARHTRVIALAVMATLCAVGAASIVSGRERSIRSQVGPLVPVLVASQPIREGKLLTATSATSLLIQRRVPARFVPPGALRSAQQAVGYRTDSELAAGDYVTSGTLVAPNTAAQGGSDASARGGRLVELAVSGGMSVLARVEPGSFVDVLVTSDRGGSPRTYLALQRVELLQVGSTNGEAATSGGGGDSPADALVTLRVTLREAVLLTAAQNFSREIRLVPRPAGDKRALRPVAVAASDLRP